jgi:glucose-6-phosphate 1-dehydrogenase
MPMLPAFDMVLFGGTGDLVMRKLLPALYHQHRDGMLSKDSRVIAVAPNDLSRADFQALAEKQCAEFLGAAYDYPTWQAFSRRIHYLQLDANNRASFTPLQTLLDDAPDKVRVFYLSTSPTLFTPICAHLADAKLITPQSRVVPEKPLGHDLQSSREINDAIGEYFSEQQIFRIDHYLGKEPVQNLLALRFGNALFEPLWRREWVRDVQITVAENSAWKAVVRFTTRSARCATCCRTTCCNCCVLSQWNRRRASTRMRCATKS